MPKAWFPYEKLQVGDHIKYYVNGKQYRGTVTETFNDNSGVYIDFKALQPNEISKIELIYPPRSPQVEQGQAPAEQEQAPAEKEQSASDAPLSASTESDLTSAQTPQKSNISIVASHGKRMICILRSFLLDYDKLKLKPVEDCINKFYRKIREVNNKGFIKEDKWGGLKKSKCKIDDFNQTFQTSGNSESSNMKCFPQFTNGSAINIEIKKIGENEYHLTVSLIPPKDKLDKDEDLENKLVFMDQGSERKYDNYNYKVPFHKLEFTANSDCFLIRNVLKSMGDQYNVIIVRHGQGYHNLANFSASGLWEGLKMGARTLGTADTHLTDKGIKDAEIGANSIKEYFKEVDLRGKCKYFSSDLYRAKETAVLIAKYFGETRVIVTQLPIIHEISNCEKADRITKSSKPDMNFPGDRKNPKDNIYCPEWFKRQMSHYSKSLGRIIKGCGEDGVEVIIDYKTFYTDITVYKLLFSSQYGYTGNRTSRFLGKDTSFLFQPFEIIELLLAFTLMDMTGNSYFSVNGKNEHDSKIGREMQLTNEGLPPADVLIRLPGFRPVYQQKAYKYITGTTGGGNRNTLKKRRKRRTNNKRRTNKRRTNKRLTNKRRTNKRENKKKRTHKRGRTIRQRK